MPKFQYLFLAFLLASKPTDLIAEACTDPAESAPVTGEQYWQRLEKIRSERHYPADVARGTFTRSHTMEGYDTPFRYMVHVPDEYDPDNAIDLHIYLHGGVQYSTTRLTSVKKRRLERLRVPGAISVYPSAWPSAKWWYESQSKKHRRNHQDHQGELQRR